MMTKKVQCDSCGQEYVIKNTTLLWLINISVIGPFLKIWGFDFFSNLFGEFLGFAFTLFVGILMFVVLLNIVVDYE